MQRISSFFEHTDLKSVEARVLRGEATADLRGRCRKLGIINTKIKQTTSRSALAGRRRTDVLFRVELYVEIPDASEAVE
jgi:hypothetical protein